MRLQNILLLSRLLTRSGDQAWDFALPISLVALFPSQFSLIAVIFLASKLGQFLFQPFLSGIIDHWKRSHTAYFGTILQLLSIVIAASCINAMMNISHTLGAGHDYSKIWFLITGIVSASIFSALGSGVMDISVGNDWIPTLVEPKELAKVNSRLKQIDLLTEVLSPVLAGFLLSLSDASNPLLGFYIVALWNVLSFIPEMFLLRLVFQKAESLQLKSVSGSRLSSGIIKATLKGWRGFSAHPSAPMMLAYALLWLSALSPHGVLLTSFLKGGWHLSEMTLGFFRGFGAIFGLAATFIFPKFVQRMGVLKASFVFILLQAMMLLLAFPFYIAKTANGMVFLFLILISRIGLYGFSLGEMEIRQRTIPLGQRGQINGVAAALTSFATLILFGIGSLISTHEQFVWLVLLSILSVNLAAFVYFRWFLKSRPHKWDKD